VPVFLFQRFASAGFTYPTKVSSGNANETNVKVIRFYTYEVIVDILQKQQSNPCRGLDRSLGLHEVERQSVHEGGRVVSHLHLQLLPVVKCSFQTFLLATDVNSES
jgi:hypothetical protein